MIKDSVAYNSGNVTNAVQSPLLYNAVLYNITNAVLYTTLAM